MRKLRIFNALFLFCFFFLLIFTLSCSRDSTKPPLSPTPTETYVEIKRLDTTETPTIIQLVRVMPQRDAECMRLQLLGHDYASFLRQEIPENLGRTWFSADRISAIRNAVSRPFRARRAHIMMQHMRGFGGKRSSNRWGRLNQTKCPITVWRE